jgi:hypothetical protein
LPQSFIGAEIRPAEERGPGAGIGPFFVALPQLELQQQLASAAGADAGGFGGDDGLIIQVVQQGSRQDLGINQWPLPHGQGHGGVDDSAFGNSPPGQTVEEV